jgi:hypothetical protein
MDPPPAGKRSPITGSSRGIGLRVAARRRRRTVTAEEVAWVVTFLAPRAASR